MLIETPRRTMWWLAVPSPANFPRTPLMVYPGWTAIVTFLIRAINDLSTSFSETSVQLGLKHDGRLNLN